jgi:hypothetical protein
LVTDQGTIAALAATVYLCFAAARPTWHSSIASRTAMAGGAVERGPTCRPTQSQLSAQAVKRRKLAEAVLAKLHGAEAIEEPLADAAYAGRFGDGHLAARSSPIAARR